ncbi:MAG: putative toxin-antitoxin system toxin component, PIN family [Saprospiraceae bacterium]|nr:putative toxin-antitoxin system toxin component, PIN family [Saprospiraceae bacterium]
MRILIDTNLWVRALISERTRERLALVIGNPDVQILGSQELIEEIRDVANRPRLKKFLTIKDVNQFLEILGQRLDLVSATTEIRVCRDPEDDYLLAICKDFSVDYLLTEDEDLLVLNPFGETQIIHWVDFEKLLLQ